MKDINDELLEHDLKVISNLKDIGAPDFFYTRLKARMEKEAMPDEFAGSIKQIVVICILTLFLFINSLILEKDSTVIHSTTNQDMEAFTALYDQNISN